MVKITQLDNLSELRLSGKDTRQRRVYDTDEEKLASLAWAEEHGAEEVFKIVTPNGVMWVVEV